MCCGVTVVLWSDWCAVERLLCCGVTVVLWSDCCCAMASTIFLTHTGMLCVLSNYLLVSGAFTSH